MCNSKRSRLGEHDAAIIISFELVAMGLARLGWDQGGPWSVMPHIYDQLILYVCALSHMAPLISDEKNASSILVPDEIKVPRFSMKSMIGSIETGIHNV